MTTRHPPKPPSQPPVQPRQPRPDAPKRRAMATGGNQGAGRPRLAGLRSPRRQPSLPKTPWKDDGKG